MNTAQPLAFARIKKQLAGKAGRDPLKAPKDALQAKLVTQLVAHYLPHLQGPEPKELRPAGRSRKA